MCRTGSLRNRTPKGRLPITWTTKLWGAWSPVSGKSLVIYWHLMLGNIISTAPVARTMKRAINYRCSKWEISLSTSDSYTTNCLVAVAIASITNGSNLRITLISRVSARGLTVSLMKTKMSVNRSRNLLKWTDLASRGTSVSYGLYRHCTLRNICALKTPR